LFLEKEKKNSVKNREGVEDFLENCTLSREESWQKQGFENLLKRIVKTIKENMILK